MITNTIKPDVAIVTDVCHDTSTPMIENKKEGDENAKSIEDFGNIKVLGQISSINHITKKKIKALSKKKFINVFRL